MINQPIQDACIKLDIVDGERRPVRYNRAVYHVNIGQCHYYLSVNEAMNEV